MEAGYIKDLHHNYLVIPQRNAIGEEAYCIKMLQANKLDLIKPELRNIDNIVNYYYDITGKQAIDVLLSKTPLNNGKVKSLFLNIINTVNNAYEYLLNVNDLLLEPEHTYLDLSTGNAYLCYLPGFHKSIRDQMVSFLEYIMNKVDYNDKEAVLMVYNLYAASREEGFTFDHLISALSTPSPSEPERKIRGGSVREKEIMPDIPMMPEKISGEKEVECYPIKTYVYTGICGALAVLLFAFCFSTKLLYNSLGNRIDFTKLFALLLTLTCASGYLMKRIWNKNSKITKIIVKEEYIDPGREFKEIPVLCDTMKINETTDDPMKEEYHPTCLLNEVTDLGCLLEAEGDEKGETIRIKEFPFVIGKWKGNVDCCLEKEVISRYHAKITSDREKYYLTDLNSTNGTCLNGEPLPCYQRRELNNGDEIALAGIKYRFYRK